MEYPNFILNQLERDPIAFWGCTNAEIMSCARKSFACALIVFIAGLFIHWVFALVISFICWFGYSYFLMRILVNKRADKPLFYEVHLRKKWQFIQPNIRYQLMRNDKKENTLKGSIAKKLKGKLL